MLVSAQVKATGVKMREKWPGLLDSELFSALNGYPGSIFNTRVVLLPAGTRVPGYPFTALV